MNQTLTQKNLTLHLGLGTSYNMHKAHTYTGGFCITYSKHMNINPFQSYVGPRPTLWFSPSAPMSGDVRHFFCCVCVPAPLLEPVRRFSSRSTDFCQQIAQVVAFLFLGRYAVGKKIGFERVNYNILTVSLYKWSTQSWSMLTLWDMRFLQQRCWRFKSSGT